MPSPYAPKSNTMKILLTSLLLSVGAYAVAQQSRTETLSSTINDDGKTYAIKIDGDMNGRTVHYDRTFTVKGLSSAQKDALKDRIMDSLRTGKITTVQPRIAKDPNATVFICESCAGRMKIQVFGDGVSVIREEYPRQGEASMFPLAMTLKPGEYRLMYWQNKVMQIQDTFTVRAGEPGEVRIK